MAVIKALGREMAAGVSERRSHGGPKDQLVFGLLALPVAFASAETRQLQTGLQQIRQN